MFRFVLLLTVVALAYGRVPRVRPSIPPLDGRIVGGVDTTIEEHPYQLSLQRYGSHTCGASLIAPNVALTAAHCTAQSDPSSFTVRAGASIRGQGGKVVSVKSVCQHPKYKPYDYDVSVLQLAESLDTGASIQIVPLQPLSQDVPVGSVATVTGWGRLSSGGALPSQLQEVQVPKISDESCQSAYPSEDITSRMSCYAQDNGGKDSCQGDSGGPLVVDGHVAGVVSWGYGCADPKYPGVYANVANQEIQEHINTCIANP